VLRPQGGEPERHVEVGRFDDPEADDVLLRLQVGPVGEYHLTVPAVDDGGGAGRRQAAGEDQWPSVWSCSLKASIAAISSAVAESVVSSSTEIKYFAIRIISCRYVAAPMGRFSPLLRTPLLRSDTLR
jgi:hypothetical protein